MFSVVAVALIFGPLLLNAAPLEMKHMKEVGKCSLCHQTKHMDHFVMLDGTVIERAQTSQLCGQCHGPKYGDWKEGLHGKQTGHWRGESKRAICIDCHEPHSPKFKVMRASPAPKFPKLGVPKVEETNEK